MALISASNDKLQEDSTLLLSQQLMNFMISDNTVQCLHTATSNKNNFHEYLQAK
jgi:hypothetical protein